MYALKTRDERKQEAEQRKAGEPPPMPPLTAKIVTLADRLLEMITPLEFVRQAAIFDAAGVVASAARPGNANDDLAPLCKMLSEMAVGYTRGKIRRMILDDEKGILLVSSLPRNRWVMILAERGVALGTLMVGMGRLVAKLETLNPESTVSKEALAGVI
jgi:hypothetical protein